jgi:hypothetical protein
LPHGSDRRSNAQFFDGIHIPYSTFELKSNTALLAIFMPDIVKSAAIIE